MRAKINETEKRKTIEKINETKHRFLEKVNKTDKYLFLQGIIPPFRKLAFLFKEANKSNKECVR